MKGTQVLSLFKKGDSVKRISRKTALDLMENSKGRFFTALFVTKESNLRKVNCQYLKNQSDSKLGYVKVREVIKLKKGNPDNIRNVNLQTLKELKIGGISYRIN